jgi:prophage tail gpP-like protein
MTKKVLNKFGLKVNENTFESWSQMNVRTSMNTIAGSFGFLDADFSGGDFAKWKIKKGDEVEVFIENETLITGYIDSIPIEYGGKKFDIQFIGRDKTCDLIDCTYNEDNNEFKKQTRANIIRRLIDPFEIELTIDSTASTEANVKIDSFKVNEGCYVYEMISEICRDAGILPLSKGDGKLTITKSTTTDKATDTIQFDSNAIYGKLIQDDSNRYSDYICKGFGIGGDSKRLEDFIEPSGVFSDPIISRYRPLTIFSDRATDSGKCKDRAKWEARLRAGFSRGLIYHVPGWMQSDGSIWRINTLVTVYDKVLNISAQEFLICDVNYVFDDEDGAFSKIHLVDKDTFSGSAADINIKAGFDD